MTEGKTWEERLARDPDLAQIRQWKKQRLPRPEVCGSPSRYMKQLLGQWNKIVLQEGVLRRLCDIGSDDETFRVIVPKQETKDMWRTYYEEMGHPGTARILSTLQQRCYWPRMTQDVKAWTKACLQCVCAKAGPEVRAPLTPILTSYPLEVVGVDFLSL